MSSPADNAQLLRLQRQLAAAQRVSQTLFQQHMLSDLIEKALGVALEVSDAESGSIILANPESQQLVFQHTVGHQVPSGTAWPWKDGIAGAVYHSGKPELIPEVKHDTRHFTGIGALDGYITRDIIAVPLKQWKGAPIGVLEILNKRTGRLDEEDLLILTVIAAFTAIAIEQARLFEEAKLAEVARLAGDISHDIKNLLQPITCGAGLLREEIHDLLGRVPDHDSLRTQKSRELCEEVIDMLFDDARRISDRVVEIADCVKGLTAPPQFAPCHLNGVVVSVFRTLGILAKKKGVLLQTKGLEVLPAIEADERRLYNAFYNLVNNAIPETPEGGSITIHGDLDMTAGVVWIAVADTGRGMPPDVRESLFTARTLSHKGGGTGLGTKIVKDVMDAHGGTITVESEEHAGTIFHLKIPLRQPVILGDAHGHVSSAHQSSLFIHPTPGG